MHRSFNFTPYNQEEQVCLTDVPPDGWRFKYPSLADNFSFNYSKLLALSYTNGVPLGSLKPNTLSKVCIIGAGIAGTEAARELARSGFTVTLIEASNRIGGRTYSYRAPDSNGSAQLTAIEQGAMRIPFFNTTNPYAKGDGPYVGGPYSNPANPLKPSIQNCSSVAEFWANQYAISTARFPDPGKAPVNIQNQQQQAYSGVCTGVYVNSGFGVDLVSLYPTPMDPTASVYPTPTQTFYYQWPADASDISSFPGTGSTFVKFYNRGREMDVKKIPNITLGHAIPDSDEYIPPTFTDKVNYSNNVCGWRAGVQALRTVDYKWTLFASSWLCAIANVDLTIDGQKVTKSGSEWSSILYNNTGWEDFWTNKVMPRYQNVNFYEVAMAGPLLPQYDSTTNTWTANPAWLKGNFGGLGMSAAEAQLFYTVGAGDGSWGAFYPNSALWALRALLFGYANQHQLILGCLNPTQTDIDTTLNPPPDQTPYGHVRGTLKDSNAVPFWQPQYAGANSFSECHLFKPMDNKNQSFYNYVLQKSATMYTSTKVTKIAKLASGLIQVSAYNSVVNKPFSDSYDYVLCCVPIWNSQTDMTIEGFDLTSLPMSVPNALDMSHWIRSAKVFVTLKEPYWKQENDRRPGPFLPQVIATNTELQDMYGLCAPTGTDPYPTTGGLALISYTWEDDAQKFLASQPLDLVKMLLSRLEDTLEKAGLPSFSAFMSDPTLKLPGSFSVWRWSLQTDYHGCAKAYQTGIENMNYALLTYNSAHAADSKLYFAGDAYAMESGWLEPALRMGLDATLNMMNNDPNCSITSVGGFKFDTDYKSANPMTSAQAQRTSPLGPDASR